MSERWRRSSGVESAASPASAKSRPPWPKGACIGWGRTSESRTVCASTGVAAIRFTYPVLGAAYDGSPPVFGAKPSRRNAAPPDRLGIDPGAVPIRMNPNHRFLVVDDFAPMREIIRKVLNELGYEHIQEANDGATALPLLQTEAFDLLITDWNMPKLPGIELLRAVRSDPKLAHLPVLMVTAEVKREQIIAATQAGVNAYIIKPFTAKALAEKVNKILYGEASGAASAAT